MDRHAKRIVLRIIALLLLLLNGLGALFGGWALITDPTGESLQLSLSHLQHAPFADYLIPGIVLFLVNGVFSMLVLLAVVMDIRTAPKLLIAQGILLAGWIIVQVIMTRTVYWLHWMYWGVGMLLMGIGFLLRKIRNTIRGKS